MWLFATIFHIYHKLAIYIQLTVITLLTAPEYVIYESYNLLTFGIKLLTLKKNGRFVFPVKLYFDIKKKNK